MSHNGKHKVPSETERQEKQGPEGCPPCPEPFCLPGKLAGNESLLITPTRVPSLSGAASE